MGVEEQSQSAAQPAGKSKLSPQGRRGRSFGPNRRGRGRRPMDRPSSGVPENLPPADLESPSVPEPGLAPSTETAISETAPQTPEVAAREMPPIAEESVTAEVGAKPDAPQEVTPAESPAMGQRPPEQRQAQVPARPSAYSRPPGHRHPQSPERRPLPQPAPPKEFRPAAPRSVQQAIEDVNEVIDSLKTALEDMEEVLETLELAERQQDADEQEIENLRRSLRQLNRPRESGHREGSQRDAGQHEGGHREGGHRH